MQAVYLTPRSTFPGSFPSNTLFGAICSAMADLGEDVGAFVDAFSGQPPLLVSSCFPFTGTADKATRLYPMPSFPLQGSTPVEFDKMKRLKKLRYVDENIFTRLSNGSLKMETMLTTWDRFSFDPKTGIMRSERDRSEFRQEEVDIPHNRINRLSCASDEFYHTNGSHYSGGGLYFLIDFRDRSYEAPVNAAIRLLADQGIGKRRSSGQGHFALTVGSCDLDLNLSAPYLTSLSRFLPHSLSPFGGEIWYDLQMIRGRSGDGMMKPAVMMLGEGAVFKNTGDPGYGRVATVRESPRMVEFGVAFPVGMRCLS